MRNALLIMKSTLPHNITWKQINWVHVYNYVEKLQQRIYRAESLGEKRKVRELQRLLLKRMMQTPVVRHTMIKHKASPYDTTLEQYFKMRDMKYNDKTNEPRQFGKKSMLELYVVKATRTVLRRERGGDLSDLADVGQVRFRQGTWAGTPVST